MRELRTYQQKAIDDTRAQFERRAKRVVVTMPTGSGKTCTGAELVRLARLKGTRVLWTAHRTELIDQAREALEDVGVTDVPVISVQTLTRPGAERPEADLIIWDEAHHAAQVSETWSLLITEYYKHARVTGFSATPERSDGTGLAPLFDAIVTGPSVRELTALGFLVPCEVIRPDRILKSFEVATTPVQAYLESAAGSQAISFHRSVELARANAVAFTAAGVPARCIDAETPPVERAMFLDEFKQGKVRVLTNVFVLTEGTDLPMAATCILARGAGSDGIFLQCVGRILRPHAGKERALLLDLTGISHARGMPEDERIYRLEGRAIRSKEDVVSIEEEGADRAAPEERVTNDKLHRFARKWLEGPEEKHATAVRWIRAGLLSGWKPEHLYKKWPAVYKGEQLTSKAFRAALAEVSPEEIANGAGVRAMKENVKAKRAEKQSAQLSLEGEDMKRKVEP